VIAQRPGAAGFTLIEVLLSLAILAAVAVPLLFVTAAVQRLARSQSDAADLQQRTRVLAEKIQRDITMAGAGPLHGSGDSLAGYLPAIVPARTGARLADPELSAFPDRITILYAPQDASYMPVAAAMPDPASGIMIDPSMPGCRAAGLCGFVEGTRALILDTSAPGSGHDVFTVTGLAGELLHEAPNPPFSRAYGAGTAAVLPVVQRVYYLDRPRGRLMMYDGFQSDLPLFDNVVDLRFAYFGDGPASSSLRPVLLSELSDGPALGIAPNRFDADLQRIRLVRVTLRLQAGVDAVRGAGPWFAQPGRSSSGYSFVPDFEVTFDVAPRNVRGGAYAGPLP
jgi:prepilin-type N-terminal cleavage/methylation domain-containing protein